MKPLIIGCALFINVCLGLPFEAFKNGPKHPVILLPGLQASQMEARVNKTDGPHFFCARQSDWFLIWLNPQELLPSIIDCFMDNIRLVYNETSKRTQNPPGVETRIPGFGDTETVEYLSNYKIGWLSYFHNLVEKLVSTLGYERAKSVRGAPYDFRKSPDENEEYFLRLKDLIEETYFMNKDQKNLLVCHSMGCLYSLYFLKNQEQKWKDKYVKALITIGAPFGGSGSAVRALLAGTNFHIPIYKSQNFRQMERTFSSLPFLMPTASEWGDRPVVTVADKNYSANEIDKLFQEVNDPEGAEMWYRTKELLTKDDDPGVDVHCIHGANVPTIETLRYADAALFPDLPELVYGDGDGTVNKVSNEACLRWAQDNNHKFIHKRVEGVGHIDLVKHDNVTDYIRDTIGLMNALISDP